ncbi:hypothetical protein [Streptomyces lunalinharesii]
MELPRSPDPKKTADTPRLRLLHATDTHLVRPYVLTPEEQREHRSQPVRRRALWLASHGIDAGPCWIHEVMVTA